MAQLLTIYSGGSLIQHVEGHKNNEQVIDLLRQFGSKSIKVSSDHHQMMYPFNINEDNYELIGWSKNFQSNTYLNGKNEEKHLPKNFLEPEIVYYKNTTALCIQSHPEWCIGSEGSDECLKLIKKYLIKNKNNKEEKFETDLILPEGVLELPPKPFGMSTYPNGWLIHNIYGDTFRFDGQNFIPSTIYNEQVKKSIDEFKKNSIGIKIEPVSIHDEVYTSSETSNPFTTFDTSNYTKDIAVDVQSQDQDQDFEDEVFELDPNQL